MLTEELMLDLELIIQEGYVIELTDAQRKAINIDMRRERNIPASYAKLRKPNAPVGRSSRNWQKAKSHRRKMASADLVAYNRGSTGYTYSGLNKMPGSTIDRRHEVEKQRRAQKDAQYYAQLRKRTAAANRKQYKKSIGKKIVSNL